jgi:propanediol utilization protein
LHLDTDEANAAEVRNGDTALLLPPFHGDALES